MESVHGATFTGVVSSFDAFVGLGVVLGDDGVERTFHCTQIADGTRTIDPGTRVRCTETPTHLGRWEATTLTPLTPT